MNFEAATSSCCEHFCLREINQTLEKYGGLNFRVHKEKMAINLKILQGPYIVSCNAWNEISVT